MANTKQKTEIAGLIIIIGVLLFNSFILHDNYIAVIYALCGLLYTFLAGKGKLLCYLFGIMSSCLYSYLAYRNSLWGNFLLNLGYYLPMQIVGIIHWRQNLNFETKSIHKTRIKTQGEKLWLLAISIGLCVVGYLIFSGMNDSHPIADSVTTMLSLVGMYLTVRRCIEQWVVWSIVNLTAIIMWSQICLGGEKAYSTIAVWSCYLLMGVYFFFEWKKEIETKV